MEGGAPLEAGDKPNDRATVQTLNEHSFSRNMGNKGGILQTTQGACAPSGASAFFVLSGRFWRLKGEASKRRSPRLAIHSRRVKEIEVL